MLGLLGLLGAIAVAGWMLMRARRAAPAESGRTVTLLKVVVILGLAAALFAAKIWPLALMVLVGAGAVAAIEVWRERAIKMEPPPPAASPPAPLRAAMSREEAASVLGVAVDASAGEVRAAHRRLISQLHPDKGGSDYLASKINQARDVLAGDA